MMRKILHGLWALGLTVGACCLGHSTIPTMISNYPHVAQNDATGITNRGIKAMGFTTGGSPYDLHEVHLSISNTGLGMILDVSLWSNNASNNPGTRLVSFESIPFSQTSGETDVVLKPKEQMFDTFRLQPNTTYWLVVRAHGAQAIASWRASNPAIVPSGVFTHFGARWNNNNGLPPHLNSTTLNTYKLRGTIAVLNSGFYLQNPANGQIGVASLQVNHFINWRTFPQVVGSAWDVLAFGRLGGTPPLDALLKNKSTGQLAFWFANGQNFYQFVNIPQVPPVVWQFKGLAQFGAEAEFPIFQNSQSGVVIVGAHNGAQITQWRIFPKVPNPAWEIVAAGNFHLDWDGFMLFRNKTTGQLAVWRTNSHDFTTWTVLPQVPSAAWDILDIIETGETGILFQSKATKEYALWLFNNEGTALTNWLPLSKQPPSNFQYKGFGLIENFL